MDGTVNEPLDELLGTRIRPSLLVDGAEDARRLIFFQHIKRGIFFEGAVFGQEAADGLAVDFASGEVNEALVILSAVLHYW